MLLGVGVGNVLQIQVFCKVLVSGRLCKDVLYFILYFILFLYHVLHSFRVRYCETVHSPSACEISCHISRLLVM